MFKNIFSIKAVAIEDLMVSKISSKIKLSSYRNPGNSKSRAPGYSKSRDYHPQIRNYFDGKYFTKC